MAKGTWDDPKIWGDGVQVELEEWFKSTEDDVKYRGCTFADAYFLPLRGGFVLSNGTPHPYPPIIGDAGQNADWMYMYGGGAPLPVEDDPKKWADGVQVSKGDSFVTTQADIDKHRYGIAGDYYIAQFDGVLGANNRGSHYPKPMRTSNDDWTFNTNHNNPLYQAGTWNDPKIWTAAQQVTLLDLYITTEYDAYGRIGDVFQALFEKFIPSDNGWQKYVYPTQVGGSNEYWGYQALVKGTWDKPKTWFNSERVTPGDIFITTEEDKNEGRYDTPGDHFKALFRDVLGGFGSRHYPGIPKSSNGDWQYMAHEYSNPSDPHAGSFKDPKIWNIGEVANENDIFIADPNANKIAYYTTRRDFKIEASGFGFPPVGSEDGNWAYKLTLLNPNADLTIKPDFDNPKVWSDYELVNIGDTFMMTVDDVIKHPQVHLGDYYQVRFSGNTLDADIKLPASGVSNSLFKWFASKDESTFGVLGSWTNPKIWKEGEEVAIGDIFIVTKEDSYWLAGDRYEALWSGIIQLSDTYPPNRQSNDKWKYCSTEKGTFGQPKHWTLNDSITMGDIFQVKSGDGDSLVVGDYYEALFTAYINRKYPENRSSNNDWRWMGSKWDHPKYWSVWLPVNKEDIFQVTAADVANNPNAGLVLGDYYQALWYGQIGPNKPYAYPPSGSDVYASKNWLWLGSKWEYPKTWVLGLEVSKDDIFRVRERDTGDSYAVGDYYKPKFNGLITGVDTYPPVANSNNSWEFMGTKYDYPSYRKMGLNVKTGDVFKVLFNDIPNPNNNHIALYDYYEALFDHVIDDKTLPYPPGYAGSVNFNWRWLGSHADFPNHWIAGNRLWSITLIRVIKDDVVPGALYTTGDFYQYGGINTYYNDTSKLPIGTYDAGAWQWKGDKFDRIKHWRSQLEASVEDLFQVQDSDPGNNAAVGDYYSPLFNGMIRDADTYPPTEGSNDRWQWMGSNFDFVRYWQRGMDVVSGEVFEVQPNSPSGGTVGDYYKALQSFTINSNLTFPPRNAPNAYFKWIGSKYDHPKVWDTGVEVTVGNIFRVVYRDVSANPHVDIVEDDLYEALSSFKIVAGDTYPARDLVDPNGKWKWIGSKFENARHWELTEAKKGDLFQVLESDLDVHGTGLVAGDYYEAKIQFAIKADTKYPPTEGSNDRWQWMGSRFDYPRVWRMDIDVHNGDVFRVQIEDAGSNNNTLGDCYQALQDFIIDSNHRYPFGQSSDNYWLWLGSKWRHPKEWAKDVQIFKQDIFQVQQVDITSQKNDNLVVGDYYEGLKGGIIEDTDDKYYYPKTRKSKTTYWQWRGSKWDYPGTWQLGLIVEEGDIFKVTDTDVTTSTSIELQQGDFYEAQFSGAITATDTFPARDGDKTWKWVGSKWSHPKEWDTGVEIFEQDIFQVQQVDITSQKNDNLVVGDYYEALKGGIIEDTDANYYYPKTRKSKTTYWQWRGSKWDYPGTWQLGLIVEEGDIFKVTDTDVTTSTSIKLQQGDFYEAQFSGAITAADTYPKRMNTGSGSRWLWRGSKWDIPQHWTLGLEVTKGDIFQVTANDVIDSESIKLQQGDFYQFQLEDGVLSNNDTFPARDGDKTWKWMGSKWSHPKEWARGIEIFEQDIFQVQQVDITSQKNDNLVVGDYYEALKGGIIEDTDANYYYPKTRKSKTTYWQWRGSKWSHPGTWQLGLIVEEGDIFKVTDNDVIDSTSIKLRQGDLYEAQFSGAITATDTYPKRMNTGSSGSSWLWRGSKWDIPQHWTLGLEVTEGDIFQVTANDVIDSESIKLQQGDYYKAVQDFIIDSNDYYPQREIIPPQGKWQWMGTRFEYPKHWVLNLPVYNGDIFQVQQDHIDSAIIGDYYQFQLEDGVLSNNDTFPARDGDKTWKWHGSKWDIPKHWRLYLEVSKGDIFTDNVVAAYYYQALSDFIIDPTTYKPPFSDTAYWQKVEEPVSSKNPSQFSNPKTWILGNLVVKDDIFQVVENDLTIQNNPKLRTGDYYKALWSGDMYDEYYPNPPFDLYGDPIPHDKWQWMAHKDSWVKTINIAIEFGVDSRLERQSIYSNGLNMVRVDIHLDPQNGKGDIVEVAQADLVAAIKLVDLDNASTPLTKQDTAPTVGAPYSGNQWMYSTNYNIFTDLTATTQNEEITTGHADTAGNAGKSRVTFYVCCPSGLTPDDASGSLKLGAIITPTYNPSEPTGDNGDEISSVEIVVNEFHGFAQENIAFAHFDTNHWTYNDDWYIDTDQDNYYLYLQSIVPGAAYKPELTYAEINTSFYTTEEADITRFHLARYLGGRCWSYKSHNVEYFPDSSEVFQYYHCVWPFDPKGARVDITIPGDLAAAGKNFINSSYYGEYGETAVCLTRFSYHYKDNIERGSSRYYDCHINLYDQYGNSGWVTIYRSTDDGNALGVILGATASG